MKRLPRSSNVDQIFPSDVEKNSPTDNKIDSHTVKCKKNGPSFLKDYLIEYAANSNLHGLKYIGEKERTRIEKIFWLLMFCFCSGFCVYSILKTYIKYNESPLIVSFAENPTPVWQIPFPAVTICPQTKAMTTKFNFTKYYHLYNNYSGNFNESLTEKERELFERVSLVCDSGLRPDLETTSEKEIINSIREVSMNVSEAFSIWYWANRYMSPKTKIFSTIVTEEGICFTFNMLKAEELLKIENFPQDSVYLEDHNKSIVNSWSPDVSYLPGTRLDTYPRRGQGYGARAGLLIGMRVLKNDLDYLCKGPTQGYKIILHNPAELPRLSHVYFTISLNQQVVVGVKPKMMVTSPGLKPYHSSV